LLHCNSFTSFGFPCPLPACQVGTDFGELSPFGSSGEVTMPLPLPKNCRLNAEERGVNFDVEIDGRIWKAFITFEALDAEYPNQDRIDALSRSSYITRKVAERIRGGDDVEPIVLRTTMFR